jgi:hypothetical protein
MEIRPKRDALLELSKRMMVKKVVNWNKMKMMVLKEI